VAKTDIIILMQLAKSMRSPERWEKSQPYDSAMIIVHHLDNSRSLRVLWLLEELGCRYRIVEYKRDPRTMLAPSALADIHPLGKAPVIVWRVRLLGGFSNHSSIHNSNGMSAIGTPNCALARGSPGATSRPPTFR